MSDRKSSAPIARREIRVLLDLSTPVVLSQVGHMAMGVIDTMMVARVGVAELAAVALAGVWAWAWGSLGQGVVHGMDPMVSQAHGAGDGQSAALALQRGLVVAGLVSIPIGLCWLATGAALVRLGQDPGVADLAQTYMVARLPGVPGFLVFVALRQYLAGRTLTRPAMWVMFLSNGLNVLFNYVLIFGKLGFPALGLLGAGIATGLTNVLLPLILLLWIRGFRLHEGAWRPWDRRSFELRGIGRFVRLGWPVGLHMFLEANAFSIAMLMVGWLGVVELGAHQIVMNMASLTYMVPLGLSIGAATRVGNLIGSGESQRVRRACWAALSLGGGTMALFGICFVVFRHELPRLYLEDATVIALAASLLPIGGAFQIADGLQVVGAGLMRGMGRPKVGALVNLVGYYGLGLPIAWTLAFPLGLGVRGIWWGLAAGLGFVALGLFIWVMRTSRRPLDDLRVPLH